MHALATQSKSNSDIAKSSVEKPARAGNVAPAQTPLWAHAALPIQTSLKINMPGDRYEQEAERVADQVMRMPEPQVQRKTCACGKPAGPDGLCADCERKQPGIQRMVASDVSLTAAPPSVHQVIRQSGRPLDHTTRAFMESRFRHNFNQVRLHTDAKAVESARSVNALAYTVGRHVVFGAGQYVPQTTSGKQLLAHELTHVVQQGNSGTSHDVVCRTTLEDCTAEQEDTIRAATDRAVERLNAATRALDVNPLAPRTRDALWLAFRDDSRATADAVRGKLATIKDALPGATIECEQPNDIGYEFFCAESEAYVRWVASLFGTGSIHLCMGSWDGNSDALRAHTLIHEGSHRFNGTGDAGYFDARDCSDTTMTASLDLASRLDNADSYACFVMMAVTGKADELAASRADYSGATRFEIIQAPAGTIDLNATSIQQPLFAVRRTTGPVAFIPGFQFRWVIRDADDNRYLMVSSEGESVFHFGNHVMARIGRATRALLKERGINSAEVLCRVRIPQGVDHLLNLPVTFTA